MIFIYQFLVARSVVDKFTLFLRMHRVIVRVIVVDGAVVEVVAVVVEALLVY